MGETLRRLRVNVWSGLRKSKHAENSGVLEAPVEIAIVMTAVFPDMYMGWKLLASP